MEGCIDFGGFILARFGLGVILCCPQLPFFWRGIIFVRHACIVRTSYINIWRNFILEKLGTNVHNVKTISETKSKVVYTYFL
jgi:hypothetical protein